LESIGDADGDGVVDLAVGAPGAVIGGTFAGTVYVFSGATGRRKPSGFGSADPCLGYRPSPSGARWPQCWPRCREWDRRGLEGRAPESDNQGRARGRRVPSPEGPCRTPTVSDLEKVPLRASSAGFSALRLESSRGVTSASDHCPDLLRILVRGNNPCLYLAKSARRRDAHTRCGTLSSWPSPAKSNTHVRASKRVSACSQAAEANCNSEIQSPPRAPERTGSDPKAHIRAI